MGGPQCTYATMERFFGRLGPRRARTIHTVCSDVASAYGEAVRTALPEAPHVIDRFHVSQQLSRVVDEVRRQTWRTLTGRARLEFKHTRFLWLRNPENLQHRGADAAVGAVATEQPDRQGVPAQGGSAPVLELSRDHLGPGPPGAVALADSPQPPGPLQESGPHVAHSSRRHPRLDAPADQQRRP
jgi:transposase